MATGKRYYWIKLKESFMTSDIPGNVDRVPIDRCSYGLLKLWQRIHRHLCFGGIRGNSAQSGDHKQHSQNCREQF